MKRAFILLLCAILALPSVAQLDWHPDSWDQILSQAKAEDKLIFVDVYTIWCGPCLKMDKDVWVDSSVQANYNDRFINVKINAENPMRGQQVAQRYGASVYPTLLYLNPGGEVISTYVGAQNKYEILDLSDKVTALYGQRDYLDAVKSNIYKDYTLQELKKILDISVDHTFDGKHQLAMNYLDKISTIQEEDIRRVMPEVNNMDLDYLGRIAPLTGTVSYAEMYVRRNSKEWVSWRTDTERAVYAFLKKYLNNGDLGGYERTLEIMKGIEGVKPRKIDNLYLDFYKQNDLNKYRDFAIYLIDEYIIPTRPEDVKIADEEKYRMLHEEISKDMAAAIGDNVTIDANSISSQTSTLDSLAEIYTISESIADQLYDISGDFFAFFDDESSKRKASFWANLATKYYPYNWKYFDNLIFLLESNGEHIKAQEALDGAKALPWYHEMRHPPSNP